MEQEGVQSIAQVQVSRHMRSSGRLFLQSETESSANDPLA